MVTSRSAAGCLLGRERRAGNRPAVHAACNYRVFSWKLNCNKSLLSAPPNTPSADWTPARGGHKGTAARKNPDQIFTTSVCAATWPKNRTNEALQQVNKGSASNGPKPSCPWLTSLFFCTSVKRNAAWFFFFPNNNKFSLLTVFFSVLKTENDHVKARLVQLLAVSSKRQGHGFKCQSWSLSPYRRRIL